METDSEEDEELDELDEELEEVRQRGRSSATSFLPGMVDYASDNGDEGVNEEDENEPIRGEDEIDPIREEDENGPIHHYQRQHQYRSHPSERPLRHGQAPLQLPRQWGCFRPKPPQHAGF